MLEILADGRFSVAGAAFAEDHVATCAFCDSVGVVAGEGLVALRPADTNLACLVNGIIKGENSLAEALTLLFLKNRPLLRTCAKYASADAAATKVMVAVAAPWVMQNSYTNPPLIMPAMSP